MLQDLATEIVFLAFAAPVSEAGPHAVHRADKSGSLDAVSQRIRSERLVLAGMVRREHVAAEPRHGLDDRDGLIGQGHQMRVPFAVAFDLHFFGRA